MSGLRERVALLEARLATLQAYFDLMERQTEERVERAEAVAMQAREAVERIEQA